jgi:hypothetical protein
METDSTECVLWGEEMWGDMMSDEMNGGSQEEVEDEEEGMDF